MAASSNSNNNTSHNTIDAPWTITTTMKLLDQPKTVHQTDFSAGTGNALQACVAALFGQELEDVPNFITKNNYLEAIENYLAPNFIVKKQMISEIPPSTKDVGKLCILRGKSPRGSHGHVVVARIVSSEASKGPPGFDYIMDPHPDGTYLDESQPFGWYMIFQSANNYTVSSDNPHALQYSQDSAEMFDVQQPPSPTFDMYKDRPIPTGQQKPRAAVHKDGDWHRSVHIWLVDFEKHLIALQKRSPHKDTFPNRWDISAAGHIEQGVSDSRQTAIRELAEELGIDNVADPQKELAFAFTCPAEQAGIGGCNCYEDVYFLERDSSTCQIHMGEAEVTAFKWMSIQDLEHALRSKDQDYVPRVDRYLEAFFKHLYERMHS